MKLLLCILSLFMVNVTYSQQKQETYKTEPKTIKYSNGLLLINVCVNNPEIAFDDNKEYSWYAFGVVKTTKGGCGGQLLHGNSKFYDDRKNLISEDNYYLGLQHGDSKNWDSLGNILETAKYRKGKQIYSKVKSEKSDNWIEWNGGAFEVGSIKKVYTSYGRLISTEEYLPPNGTNEKVTIFYENGKVHKKYTTYILFDWLFGEYIEYYENGNVQVSGHFEDSSTLNIQIGDWKYYNENGTLRTIEKFRFHVEYNSEDHSKRIVEGGEYFDEQQKLWVRHGKWEWSKPDGSSDYIKSYDHGKEVEIKK